MHKAPRGPRHFAENAISRFITGAAESFRAAADYNRYSCFLSCSFHRSTSARHSQATFQRHRVKKRHPARAVEAKPLKVDCVIVDPRTLTIDPV